MDDEVELISDGNGLAIVGNPSAVERFMTSSGLSSIGASSQLKSALRAGASAAPVGAEVVANSGRWVKLTEESARAVKQFGLMNTNTPGVQHAMVGSPGEIKQWLQIASSPSSLASNPAVLAGAAGVMAQLAMKQQMDAITNYLAVIDEKLDDVMRSQTNQILARIDAVDLVLAEAVKLQETTGRVSDITWSKVQNQSTTVLETQAYAVRQLADIADKLERKQKVGDIAKTAKEAETEVGKWLAVLARCLQLHDGVGIIELDRVMDSSSNDLDAHRLGLETARRDRLELLSTCTEKLLERMNTAVETANSKVLFNPTSSPSVVNSRNQVVVDVYEFQGLLGIEGAANSSEAKRWKEAATESLDAARTTGAKGLDDAKRLGRGARDQAKSMRGKLSEGIADRKFRRRKDDEQQG